MTSSPAADRNVKMQVTEVMPSATFPFNSEFNLAVIQTTLGSQKRHKKRYVVMAEKLHRIDDEQVGFFCPGCQSWHGVRIAGEGHPRWLWNGNMEFPTFTPGIQIGDACHSFVINGTIQFLRGSTHSRSGQTVEIPDWHKHAEESEYALCGVTVKLEY
jgi:hypothetical protein